MAWNMAPDRRPDPRQRRELDRRPLPGEGVTTMKVLGISGACAATRTTALCSRRRALRRRRARALGRPEGRAALRRGRRRRAGARRRLRAFARRSPAPTRSSSRPPSTTRDPRPAEERDRLGLAPARRRPSLRNKPVAVVGASTGSFGAVWAQAELRKVLARPARASSRRSWRSRGPTSGSPRRVA